MNRHLLLAVLFALFSAVIPGCGADDGQDAQAAGTPTLSGVYEPADPGAIGSITFSDDQQYLLMPSGCADGDCEEFGTYRLDAASKSVVLEDDITGQPRSLPLEILETASATPSPATGVAPLALVGSGRQLATTGHTLVRPITRLVLAGQRLTQKVAATPSETGGEYMQCSMNGNVFSVNALKECYDGLVTVKSLRDNSVRFRVDVYKARLNYRNQTWSQFIAACDANKICALVEGALIAKYTKPLRALWIALKVALKTKSGKL